MRGCVKPRQPQHSKVWRDTWPRVRYCPDMKRNPEHRELDPNDPRLQEWEWVFRAAEAGQFPNNALAALEMSECLRDLRRSRIIKAEVPGEHEHLS
jgi:hypothetical protein